MPDNKTEIVMTPEELEQTKSEAVKTVKEQLEAKEKELSQMSGNSELIAKMQEQIEELKTAQEKALEGAKEVEKSEEVKTTVKADQSQKRQDMFKRPIEVKDSKFPVLGTIALATALGVQQRKTALEVLNDHIKSNSYTDVAYKAIRYMENASKGIQNGHNNFINQAKSIGMGSILEGAGLGAPDADAELIQALRPENSIQSMTGLYKEVRLTNGTAKVNIVDNGMSAYHVGSKSGGNESNAGLGQRILNAKKIAGLSVIDNDRLRFGDFNVASEIEQDIMNGIIQEWDRGFLDGSGSDHEPSGLIVSAGNSFTRTTSPDATKIGKDLRKAKRQLQDDDIKLLSPAWVMRPATRTAIEDQYTSNKDQMHYASRLESDGTLMGYRVITTNNMPTGTDHCVLLVDASELILGLGYGIVIDVDSSVAFDNDQTKIRGLFSYDLAYKRTNGICKIGSTSDWEDA
jgi:HK97 family phage major capsid protein